MYCIQSIQAMRPYILHFTYGQLFSTTSTQETFTYDFLESLVVISYNQIQFRQNQNHLSRNVMVVIAQQMILIFPVGNQINLSGKLYRRHCVRNTRV